MVKVRFAAMVVCLAVVAGSPAFSGEGRELKTPKEKISYALGVNIGSMLKHDSFDVDPEVILQGIRDVLSGKETGLTLRESKEIIMAAQKEIKAQQKEQRRKAGEEFLAKNKMQEGVKTLPSGLQYRVIAEGKGNAPKATDTVTVNFRGTLMDGTEFDSTDKRGGPATFPVSGVIRGWAEALQQMKEGAKWRIFVPSELAYGETGRQGIPEYAVLIFDVELLSIKKAAAPKEGKPKT